MTRARLVALAVLAGAPASADPLQLRAAALASTASPAGVVVLDASGDVATGLSAEAVLWSGSAGDRGHADVLVMVLRGRTADGALAGRAGRFVMALGALRPLQLDGVALRARLPLALDAEAYAGIPVVPAARVWSWAAGGRVARRLGDSGAMGVAYAQQRDAGRLTGEEVGLDAGAALGRRDDVGARLAYDLATPGLAELAITASHRGARVRTELYAGYRAASHLIPATSLFSVLGDVPAERAGAVATWRAAPRLDVIGELGGRRVGGDVAPEAALRARLRLDERGAGALTVELRRDGVADDAWTGARAGARIALPHALVAGGEVELVRADRGHALWPWALASLARDDGVWLVAIAVEASEAPAERRIDVLGQLGRRWGAR